jgi:hypothetical protein
MYGGTKHLVGQDILSWYFQCTYFFGMWGGSLNPFAEHQCTQLKPQWLIFPPYCMNQWEPLLHSINQREPLPHCINQWDPLPRCVYPRRACALQQKTSDSQSRI